MYATHRHLHALLCLTALCLVSNLGLAWVETQVKSAVATLDVARSGKAKVHYEISLSVRGGPLKGFSILGVDSDAKFLENATVTRTDRPGQSLPLLLELREDGAVRLDINHEQGIRRGTYLFKFAYDTHLLKRSLIRSEGAWTEVRWVGPRLDDGVDNFKVIFRVPPATAPPKTSGAFRCLGCGSRGSERRICFRATALSKTGCPGIGTGSCRKG